MKKHATISPCGRYRYWLERSWGEGGDFLNWIMLNPSTADGLVDDPTVRKCIGFAKRWGFIGMHIVNLFALRATDPRALKKAACPIGPENDTYIDASLLSAGMTVAAWGTHGRIGGRAKAVLARVKGPLHVLDFNKNGSPKHPLYACYGVKPELWLVGVGS